MGTSKVVPPYTHEGLNLFKILEALIPFFKKKECLHFCVLLHSLLVFKLQAEGCTDPLDVYRYLQAQGIGTMQASFYIAWSEEYEQRGNSRMADSVFQDGLKCGAEPLDKLHQFHKQVIFIVFNEI